MARPGRRSSPSGARQSRLDGPERTDHDGQGALLDPGGRCFAGTLGGLDGRYLFLLCNEFEGADQLQALQARRHPRKVG